MITSSEVNRMCALLEPHEIGVALARRLQELYKHKLNNLDFRLKMMKGEGDGEITDEKLERAVQLERQWHAANEVYVWVTNLLEQKEVPNG
jgi:hypothetical protein